MARIFISYRQEDTLPYAGRLFDRLEAHFGRDHVFMDIDTIEPGLDFVEVIHRAVSSCDALVAVIGKHWLSVTDDQGQRRLDNPEDFVRLEIAAALERNVRVIPALVAGARMPRSADLPGNLKSLARRNALEINDKSFRHAADLLIHALENAIREISSPAPESTAPPPSQESRPLRSTETAQPSRKSAADSANWVRIGNFEIGKYPVTVAEFAKFVESGAFGDRKKFYELKKPNEWEKQIANPTWPVTSVSWYDAEAYCKWAGCRLPSDSEWEQAARGEKGREYPWGNERPDEARANYGRKVGHPTPVGSYPKGATPEGVHDMAGNVWEWTADWSDGRNMYKSMRGGSWHSNPEGLLASDRGSHRPGIPAGDVGFRCTREAIP